MATVILGRWIAAIVTALFLAVFAAPASAARPTGTIDVCVTPAKAGMTAAGLFARPALFACASQAGSAPGDYWVLSRPLPAVATPMLTVRTASVWQRRVTLYVHYADGAIRRVGFTSATTAPHLSVGALIDVAVPDHPARPIGLLWHVEGSGGARGIVIGARVIGTGERYREDLAMSVLYAALGGMVVALLVYNLALWGALRQPFQPVYCAMLFFLLLYGFSSSGLVEQLTGLDNNRRLQLNSVLLALTASSAITFGRLFFGPEVYDRWLRRASHAVIVALLVSAGAYALLAPWHFALLDRAITGAFVALMLLVPAVFHRAWRTRSPNRWLFAIAWGAPIAFSGVRVAAALDIVGWHFWIDHSTVPALAMEAGLSALAIAGRVRVISRERDEAREQEVAARLLADTDPLTGLLNRRSFLAQAIGRADDQALVLVDIDHFKHVNETIGHDGGDEVLRIVARALRAGAPADSLVARIGGEEFAILTPASHPPSPADILDRLRAMPMPYDLTVTASTGACVGPLAGETDWKRLYRHADRALFEAKAAGRDRSRTAPPLAQAA